MDEILENIYKLKYSVERIGNNSALKCIDFNRQAKLYINSVRHNIKYMPFIESDQIDIKSICGVKIATSKETERIAKLRNAIMKQLSETDNPNMFPILIKALNEDFKEM